MFSMKTLNTLYLSLILLSSTLTAQDELYSFMGIQTANSFVEGESIPNLGVKYGLQSKKYRTTFNYTYGENSQSNLQTLTAQVDTGIFTKSFRSSSFKPYVGLAFGIAQEKNDLTVTAEKGEVYGAATGIAYIFNDQLDFDLSYRYLKTRDMSNIDEMSDISLSMHYFY